MTSLDITYFDVYGKIRIDFFLIFVIDKNSLKNNPLEDLIKQLNVLLMTM